MAMTTVAVTPGAGANIAVFQDGSAVDHPVGVLEYISGTSAIQVSAANPMPVTAASLPLPTGAAADASVNGILVAQGSATSGEKGPLVQGAVTTAAPTYTTAQTSPISIDTAGNVRVLAAQGGTWNIGTVTTVAAVTAITNPLPAGTNTIGAVSLSPATSGGLSTSSTISAATTNATSIKGSAGQVFGYSFDNTTGSPVFVKFYDKATAPTVGTDTPIRRMMVPANGGRERTLPNGLQFSAGIAFAITANAADADTTAVTSGAALVNIDYK